MFRTYSINNVNNRKTASCMRNNSLCHLCGSFESLRDPENYRGSYTEFRKEGTEFHEGNPFIMEILYYW